MSYKKILTAAVVVFLMSCQISFADSIKAEWSITISLVKNGSQFSVKNMALTENKSGYLLQNIFLNKMHYGRMISGAGETLGYFRAMELAAKVCNDGFGKDDGCHSLSTGEIVITTPRNPNASSLEFFTPAGKKILTIDITSVGK